MKKKWERRKNTQKEESKKLETMSMQCYDSTGKTKDFSGTAHKKYSLDIQKNFCRLL